MLFVRGGVLEPRPLAGPVYLGAASPRLHKGTGLCSRAPIHTACCLTPRRSGWGASPPGESNTPCTQQGLSRALGAPGRGGARPVDEAGEGGNTGRAKSK